MMVYHAPAPASIARRYRSPHPFVHHSGTDGVVWRRSNRKRAGADRRSHIEFGGASWYPCLMGATCPTRSRTQVSVCTMTSEVRQELMRKYSYESILRAVGQVLDEAEVRGFAIEDDEDGLMVRTHAM